MQKRIAGAHFLARSLHAKRGLPPAQIRTVKSSAAPKPKPEEAVSTLDETCPLLAFTMSRRFPWPCIAFRATARCYSCCPALLPFRFTRKTRSSLLPTKSPLFTPQFAVSSLHVAAGARFQQQAGVLGQASSPAISSLPKTATNRTSSPSTPTISITPVDRPPAQCPAPTAQPIRQHPAVRLRRPLDATLYALGRHRRQKWKIRSTPAASPEVHQVQPTAPVSPSLCAPMASISCRVSLPPQELFSYSPRSIRPTPKPHVPKIFMTGIILGTTTLHL